MPQDGLKAETEMLDLSSEHVAGTVSPNPGRAGLPAPGGPGRGPVPGGPAPRAFWTAPAVQSLLSWELPFILTLEGPCLLMAAKADFVLKGLQAGHAGLGCTGQRPGASGEEPRPHSLCRSSDGASLTSESCLHGTVPPQAGMWTVWRLLKTSSASASLGKRVDFLANCCTGCVGICFVLPNSSY